MRLCQRDGLLGWQGRMMARAESDYWLPVGLRECILAQAWFAWDERTDQPRPRPRRTDHGLTFAPMPAWATEDCGGSSDLAEAFGLVGGPGAVGLPAPVDDLRTETRAVGW